MAAKQRWTTASYEHRARDEFEFGRLGLKALADVANETGSELSLLSVLQEEFRPGSPRHLQNGRHNTEPESHAT